MRQRGTWGEPGLFGNKGDKQSVGDMRQEVVVYQEEVSGLRCCELKHRFRASSGIVCLDAIDNIAWISTLVRAIYI